MSVARRRTRSTRALLLPGLALLAAGCALLAAPMPPPPHSQSALRLVAGPHRVLREHDHLEDSARGRSLPTTVWFPADASGPRPLVLYAHGFLGSGSGGAYLAEHLASWGYVVAAATHPNTTLLIRRDAKVADVVEQPGDLSFVLDRLLEHGGAPSRRPPIDPSRIAAVGHSLGGLTATLAAFHPRLRDARIAAVVSIAGPMSIFEPRFFATARVPFLMVAGGGDVIVDYRTNAFVTLDRVPSGTLVLLAGASHTGFDDAMSGLPRLLDNPDRLGCWMLDRTLHLDAALRDLPDLARDGDGVTTASGVPVPCTEPPPEVAMDPARQHMITELAVHAFLDAHFALTPAERAAAARYLDDDLPRDFPEASVTRATTIRADPVAPRGPREQEPLKRRTSSESGSARRPTSAPCGRGTRR